jgi:glycosyltransferase involved in cell wall biosynthesis
MQLSILIPIYNEQKSLRKTIQSIRSVMDHTYYEYEIIAIDDRSTDSSRKILESIEGIRTIYHRLNKGYSNSLKDGIKAAKYEHICITDADGTYPVHMIPKLMSYADRYDMVIGKRRLTRSGVPYLRRPAKFFLNWFASYIAGRSIPDLNSGLRIFTKTKAMQFWNLYPERFSFTSTITMAYMTNYYTVRYIPIPYYKRSGSSTIHPINDTVGFISLLTRLAVYFRPLRVFVPASFSFFLLSLIVAILSLRLGRFLDTTVTILFITSVQLLFLGLIADMIAKKLKD